MHAAKVRGNRSSSQYGRLGETMYNKWTIKASAQEIRNDPRTKEISDTLGVSLPTAQLLINRGYDTPETASAFLSKTNEILHDPFLMNDMSKAADIILSAVSEGKKIVIYGDYDVDGVTSVSILYIYLRELGANVGFYIPCRIGEGYGVSEDALTKLREDGAETVITVDTGITAVEEAEFAAKIGIDMVITDHHECHEKIPNALAVVNPRRPDCEYPFKELAGVGVVYKLLCALEITSHPDEDRIECMRRISAKYCDLVAIGTIADVMPIKDENRLIVAHGLEIIKNSPRPGLTELFEASDSGFSTKTRKITSGFIGYTVAPRLNAAGRIENASLSVELFLATTRAEAEPIAKRLCDINRRRQKEENVIVDEAYAKIGDNYDFERNPVIVLDDENWHRGVIGIVSSRITERYGCPSILISFEQNNGAAEEGLVINPDDVGKGSGRSVKGMNLVDALTYCGDLLEKHGGHELAAGLSIKRCNLDAFREKINEYARNCFSGGKLQPTVEADCELLPEDITMAQCNELFSLEPYGVSNPIPLFVVRDMTISDISAVGSGRHAKISVRSGDLSITAMYFRKTLAELDLYPGDKVDILCSLDVNEFQGMKSLQFIVKDMKLSDGQREAEESARATYALLWNSISKGDALEYEPDADCCPDRNDFAAVYSTLKHELHLEHEVFSIRALLHLLKSCGYDIGYVKLKFILKVFEELNLLGINEIDSEREIYRFSYVYVKNKTSLDKSNIFRRLRTACQNR